MSAPKPAAPGNLLLAALPPAEYRRLLHDLRPVDLPTRAVLHEPGEPIAHVYFPHDGVLSLITPLADGSGVEVGLVGREGMAGLSVLLGYPDGPARCVVQVGGRAARMAAEVFRDRVRRNGPLHALLLRYTHAFLAQLSQAVACNSRHSVAQRCCRWLLMMHSRLGTDDFPLTHEFLAAMLGVRRASVTEVAGALQQARLIRYSRGRMSVLDRRGLESSACECFAAVQAEYDRLLR